MDILKSHNPESGISKRNEESGLLDFRDIFSWWWWLLPLCVFKLHAALCALWIYAVIAVFTFVAI